MTRSERAHLQSALLDSVRAASVDRPTNVELARVAGCDRTELSRFESGERRIDLDELVALGEVYGPEAVLQPLAERLGGRVVLGPVSPQEHGDPLLLSIDGGGQLVELQRSIGRAQQDGSIDEGEAADCHRQIDALVAHLRRVAASIQSRRVARRWRA